MPAERKMTFAPDGMHLLRTTQQIQYQLSQMADQKASMLLGITFVIFTITLGQARVSTPGLPVLILGAGAFVAALITVVAVLPTTRPPTGPPGAQNMLFFGAFTRISEADYVAHLLDTCTDTRALYEAFARDIYQNGKVLSGKKYRLLGWAYTVLLAGLIASAAVFVLPYAGRLAGL